MINIGDKVNCIIKGKLFKFVVAEVVAFVDDNGYWTKEIVKTTKNNYILITHNCRLFDSDPESYKYQKFKSLDDLVRSLDTESYLDRKLLDSMGKLDELSEEI